MKMDAICALSPVIPVITIDNIDHAVPLAKALCDGGLHVLEITLRTPIALDAIHIMAQSVPDAIIGAGTVLSPIDMQKAKQAGAKFAVSPGATQALLDEAHALQFPFLPGVSTPSEAMNVAHQGYHIQKFFPAEANGGVPVLKAWSSPLAHIAFCPTGGITPDNVKDYLDLPNVICVGGTWLNPQSMIRSNDWSAITKLAKQALN